MKWQRNRRHISEIPSRAVVHFILYDICICKITWMNWRTELKYRTTNVRRLMTDRLSESQLFWITVKCRCTNNLAHRRTIRITRSMRWIVWLCGLKWKFVQYVIFTHGISRLHYIRIFGLWRNCVCLCASPVRTCLCATPEYVGWLWYVQRPKSISENVVHRECEMSR